MEIKILTDVCRICLNDNNLLSVFDIKNDVPVCDKIMACAAVHIAMGDPLPNQICSQCFQALEISYLFKTKCEQTDRQLRKILKDQTDVNSSIRVTMDSCQSPVFKNFPNFQYSTKSPNKNSKLSNEINYNCENDTILSNVNEEENMNTPEIVIENAKNSVDGESKENNQLLQIKENSYLLKDYSRTNKTLLSNGSFAELNTFINEYQNEIKSGETIICENNCHFSSSKLSENSSVNDGEMTQQQAESKATDEIENSNAVVYFDHVEMHLGEECEVITDNGIMDENISNIPVIEIESNDIVPVKNPSLPKGKFVIVKSQNIQQINLEEFQKQFPNDLTLQMLNNKTKQFESLFKSEIPEPVTFIETETIKNENEILINEKETMFSTSYHNITESPMPKSNQYDNEKYRGRGRPRKSDKYKPPHGVSYLKSGRKNTPIFIRSRKRPIRYEAVKNDSNTTAIYTRSLPIVKRSRVEKITPLKRLNDKKPLENRKLSTKLILSEKKFNKLNDPQKQVLYQRLKLQNFRPTSKKDITERGTPQPIISNAISKLNDDNSSEDNNNKLRQTRSQKQKQKSTISDDLAIIKSSNRNKTKQNLQTIDQDLKLINGSSYCNNNVIDDRITNGNETFNQATKPGRHTAIKSKRPRKRNHSNEPFDPRKVEIELKMVSPPARKSERQRSPKKIFPEIDIFASPKRKVIEIPIEKSEYESDSDDKKLIEKISIVSRRSSSVNSNSNFDHINTEKLLEKSTVFKEILDTRVQLDYGAGLSCNVCGKSFPYRSHLIRHVRTHTGLKPFSCQYCKKNFTSQSSLSIHIKNHIGDHPYSCEVCGRGFVQPSVLKRHMLSHTGEHPFQCDVCYKTFVHDSSLKTHLRMHMITEPQHKCDICEKRFKYISTLRSHLKTHSGIKPYTCAECRKAFFRRSLLTRHMRSHTKERPYKCKLCKARFAYSGGLASHRKLHTGVRPFECSLCQFTFFRSSHLKNHMLKIHNNGVLINCQRCNLQFDSKPLFKAHLSSHIKKDPMVDNDVDN